MYFFAHFWGFSYEHFRGLDSSSDAQIEGATDLKRSRLANVILFLGGQQILINTSDDSQSTSELQQGSNQQQSQVLQIPLSQLVYTSSSEMDSDATGVAQTQQLTTTDGMPVIIQSQLGSSTYYTQDSADH